MLECCLGVCAGLGFDVLDLCEFCGWSSLVWGWLL